METKDDSLAHFFQNMNLFQGLYPYIASCTQENMPTFEKMLPQLYSPLHFFFAGTGRSGLVAYRGVDNFYYGLQKEAFFLENGETPGSIRKGDMFIMVSGSGGTTTSVNDTKYAKDQGMIINLLTFNRKSPIAEITDNLLKIPGQESNQQAKEYAKRLGNDGEPVMVMGTASEFGALSSIDALSYGLAHSNNFQDFYTNYTRLLYDQLTYAGNVNRKLQEAESQQLITSMTSSLAYGKGNVSTVAAGFSGQLCHMFTIRLGHAVHTRDGRKIVYLTSKNFPQYSRRIDKDTQLVAVSGSGETKFTIDVAETHIKTGCKVFAVTSNENSTLAKLVGKENTLVLPTSKEFMLKDNYSIRDFDSVALMPLDCIAMETMRLIGKSEDAAKQEHNRFR
ncbi:SIS domain-containing protein [archaeon]|nr:MAG: SIS domain-containing protein [archaeon]